MSYCDDKKLVATLNQEARAEIEARLESGIADMLEYPFDKSNLLKNKLKDISNKIEKRDLRQQILKEKKRYLEHSKLFKHLLDGSIKALYESNAFVIPNDFVDNRLDWIQGIFQEAYGQSTFSRRDKGVELSGLNNSEKWDDSKIRYVLNKIQRWESRVEKSIDFTSYEDTIKKPLLTAASLDLSGQAMKLVKSTQSLLDTYLQRGYPWKISITDPTTGQKNPISLESIDNKISGIGARGQVGNLDSTQKSIAASQLSEELLHNEVREIMPKDIPTNPKDFVKWRNSWGGKKFFDMIKFESERHEIGDSESRYVMIPLHSDKTGIKWLRKQRSFQLKEEIVSVDPGEKENAFLVYRIPDNLSEFFNDIKKNNLITEDILKTHLLPTELEEGFFTAQEHRVYKYETIPNTMIPKRKYANWTKGVKYKDTIYEPPDGWMPEMWESIDMQREWNELFFQKVLKNDHRQSIMEYESFKKQVVSQLTKQGWNLDSIEEAINKVNVIGGLDFNISEDKDGNFVSSNSFVRKASKFSYGHIKFERPVYESMMEEAMHVVSTSYLPEIEAQLATDYNILNSNESDVAEKSESLERISEFEDKKEYYESMIVNMEQQLYGDNDSEEDKQRMVLVSRILATKGRTLFTDHKRRRKDRGIWSEYVDQATRANELTKLKIELLKTVLALQNNPSLVNYLIDQAKASAGNADIESGFLNLNYSDKVIGESLGVPTEEIRDKGLIIRGYKTGANLGSYTSLTNNTQRINNIINYGFEGTWKAMMAVRKGDENGFSSDEIRQQVEETGVLHPGNAFIDMLTMGVDMSTGTEYKEMLLPLVDTMRLYKATSLPDFLNNSKNWDKLISSAQSRGAVGEKIQIEELKRIKTELYNIMHEPSKDNKKERDRLAKRLKKLRLGLTLSNINRLVRWKLQWFPLGVGRDLLTMSGSEEQMRLEAAYQGMKEAFDMGRVNVTPNKKWKYTDSQDAVDMARLYVYYNLFGFTKVIAPKMFRSAVGGTGLQWRQYDYNQIVLEHEIFRSAALSPEFAQKYPSLGVAALAPRITFQIMKKIIRGGSQAARLFGLSKEQIKYWTKYIKINKQLDDKNLDKATNLFLTRGLAAIFGKMMYLNFAPYTILRTASTMSKKLLGRNKVNQRLLFGLESPLISKMITMSLMMQLAVKWGTRGLDDEDDTLEDFLRDMPFSAEVLAIFLWIKDFSGNAYRGARPYLPTPIKEITKAIDTFAD
tara:strand:- start:462 stop:4148 length:3687 start_codon:yes stop_codon:yes gene_type:complete